MGHVVDRSNTTGRPVPRDRTLVQAPTCATLCFLGFARKLARVVGGSVLSLVLAHGLTFLLTYLLAWWVGVGGWIKRSSIHFRSDLSSCRKKQTPSDLCHLSA